MVALEVEDAMILEGFGFLGALKRMNGSTTEETSGISEIRCWQRIHLEYFNTK